ncbi:MAG: hypothetical protein HZC02_01240 [Candidatus Levybacteria bacterium]|nr:hypothetical protein [Candidatus Levybacteria bacterium]
MKNYIAIILISIALSLYPQVSQAVTPTPSPKPTSESVTEKLSNQINDLKEKIASKVATLKLVEKRGTMGNIKEVNNSQITLLDLQNQTRIIDLDEITKFSSGTSSDFGLSDLKTGMKISAIGLYNKDSQKLLARFIEVVSTPIVISGAVSEKDKEDFTLKVALEDGGNYIIDVENVTKTFSYIDTDSEKSGFSEIEEGNRVYIVGFADKKEKNRIVASRILIFSSLPKNPKIVIAPDAVDGKNTVVTSSGSGKKLTPITR